MRHRERLLANVYEHVDTTCTYVYIDNGVVDHMDTVVKDRGDRLSEYHFESIDDIVTPNFKKLSAEGKIINNPYSKQTILKNVNLAPSVLAWTRDLGNGWTRETTYEGLFYDIGSADSFVSSANDINIQVLIDKAVTSVYANMDASKASILSTVAEIDKTISSICSIFWRVLRIYRSVRRLDLKALKGEISPSELKDRYMEARYAIRPLVIDTQQILSAAMFDRKNDRRTYRSYESDSCLDTVSHDTTSTEFVFHWVDSTQRSVSVRAGVLTDISGISALDVWGINHIFEACWEIVPFSFIIDWFTNIGNLIRSWTPEPGINILSSWVTVEDITVDTRRLTGMERNTASSVILSASGSVSGAFATRTNHLKYRITNPPKPWIPHFDLNLSIPKIADLLIILNNFRK